MPLSQVTAGSRAVISQINAYYNLLKGVAASGETITLIYNAAPSLLIQPSSDPAASTDAIRIANNAGTVQAALTFDGRLASHDGAVGTPGHTFDDDRDVGLYRIGANDLGVAVAGAKRLRVNATSWEIIGGSTDTVIRNNADSADNLKVVDAGAATFRTTVALGAATASRLARTGSASLAQDAVADLGVSNSFIGFVFVTNRSSARSAIFEIQGGVNATAEVSDPGGIFSATKDTATSVNVYWETDRYKIQNKRVGAISYEVFLFAVDV